MLAFRLGQFMESTTDATSEVLNPEDDLNRELEDKPRLDGSEGRVESSGRPGGKNGMKSGDGGPESGDNDNGDNEKEDDVYRHSNCPIANAQEGEEATKEGQEGEQQKQGES